MNIQAKVQASSGNFLLTSLSPDCRAFLEERMITKPITPGEVLCKADAPLQHLIFPHDGLISLQSILKDGRTVEKTSVGMDGFIGVEAILGETRFPCHAVTVISGRASWLSVDDFKDAMEKFPCVQPILSAYTVRKFRRMMQAVACASVHSARQRIATWLLHADDRSETSSFELTQRTLANIFGLRLATVSDACSRLQNAGALDQARGTIRIVNRPLLEAQACECYEAVRLNH